MGDEPMVYAVVDYDDETNYVQPKIVQSLKKLVPGIRVVKTTDDLPKKEGIKVLDWSSYEKLDFDSIMEKPEDVLSCSYIIRYVVPLICALASLRRNQQKSPHPQALPRPNRPPPHRQKPYLHSLPRLPRNLRIRSRLRRIPRRSSRRSLRAGRKPLQKRLPLTPRPHMVDPQTRHE